MRTLLHHPNDVFVLLRENVGCWIERDDIIAHTDLNVRFSDDAAARAAALDGAITQLRNAGHVIEQREESGQMFYRLQQL